MSNAEEIERLKKEIAEAEKEESPIGQRYIGLYILKRKAAIKALQEMRDKEH